MKNKLDYSKYIVIFLLLISFVSCGKDLRSLSTTIYPINNKLNDKIISENVDLEKDNDSYFSYNFSSESNLALAFTIRNSNNGQLNVTCFLSTSENEDDIIKEFESKNNICNKYENSDNRIINIIVSLSEYETGAKLYLKIKSDTNCKITLYFRNSDSYLTEIPETVDAPYAYQAVEFNAKDYYSNNKQILLISSEANSLIFYAHSNNEISKIDETSIVAISEQSLAAHFWDYDKVILFIGSKNDYQEISDEQETSNDSINITKEEISDINIYYYMGSDLDTRFFSFYNDCQNENSEHYLFVNYASLAEKDNLYFKFQNLIGVEPLLADFLPETTKISDLKFNSINRYKSFTKTEKSIHVFKLKCSAKENKMIANIKYSSLDNEVDSGKVEINIISDFYTLFSQKKFTVDYSNLVNSKLTEFVIEIFTTSTEEEKTFNVEFEGEKFEMNNKYKHIFNITDNDSNQLTINNDESISTIISISPQTTKANIIKDKDKHYIIYNFKNSTGGEAYIYYIAEHEYDANYEISFNITNQKEYTIPVCYYLYTTSLLQLCSQNCFLLPVSSYKILSFKNIFKEIGDDTYNLEEPKYSIVFYNYNANGDDYSFSNFTYKTDLPTSISINNYYEGHKFLFLEYTLVKSEYNYFNVRLPYSGKENHIDLYILNNEINSNEIEIECISAYEISIKSIEPLFTTENNLCYIINNDDTNTNIIHVIVNNNSQNSNETIIIRVKPTTQDELKVKFIVDEKEYIRNDFEIKDIIKELEEPSVFKIYEINKTTVEEYYSQNSKKIVVYSQDEIKFYGKKGNNFTKIKKGNFIIIDSDNLKDDYDKFLLIFGRYCEYYCESNLNYQVSLINLLYDIIDGFDDYHSFIFNSDRCASNQDYYILLDYGKKYGKNDIYISKHDIHGNSQNVYYINPNSTKDFIEGEKDLIGKYLKLGENNMNIFIIKFTCNNYLFSYFDFYTKNYTNEIQLKPGTIQHFHLKSNTEYAFNFELASEIKIVLLNDIKPEFKAEGMVIESSDENTIYLKKGSEEINSFNIITKENEPIIGIASIISPKDLTKLEIDNLYKSDDKFIYDIPTNISDFTMIIKRQSSRLRLLKEENGDETKVCYNLGKLIVLDENNGNCLTITDSFELGYNMPEKDTKSYMVLYSTDKTQGIDIDSIKTSDEEKKEDDEPKEEEDKDNEEETGDEEEENDDYDDNEEKTDKKDNKGTSWVVILIIVVVILVIIAIVALIVVKNVRKQVTSEDIEKNFKQSSESQVMT